MNRNFVTLVVPGKFTFYLAKGLQKKNILKSHNKLSKIYTYKRKYKKRVN